MRTRGEAIVLIGFMAAGKSAVGRVLASLTGLPLHDTDEMVSAESGMEIPRFFAERGEEEFRAREAAVVRGLSAKAAIIATGGGVVLKPENVAKLRELGTIAHLSATEEVLWNRIEPGPTRPLLATENPRMTLTQLLRVREPLYRSAADMTIETTALTAEETAAAVLRAWREADGSES